MGVAELVSEIDAQLVDFRNRVSALETARKALVGVNDATATGVVPSPAPASPSTGRGRGRPRGGGNRADQALKLVTAEPGIAIPELARKMGIEPNYLYRVMPKLAKDNQIRREGQGWVPVS